MVEPAPEDSPQSATPDPPFPSRVRVPVGDRSLADRVRITENNDLISLTIRGAPLNAVLGLLAEQHQLNIVAGNEVDELVTATLNDVRLEEALDALLSMHGYTWTRQHNIILVTSLDGEKKTPVLTQGQVLHVFALNYVSSEDVDKVVKGLLSPVGMSFFSQTNPMDARRNSEQIVVQDLPPYVQRVAEYIEQVDRPPKQVEVEVHVLQVDLKNDLKHGVNFQAVARIAKAHVSWGTVGLANPTALPASLLRVPGTDLTSLIEVLQATTDAKTLAAPKLTVINGQDGKIQIGSKLGYKTLQQTTTSTLQNVSFLDTGVILKVTPFITQDGQVLLKVNPSVSDGTIAPDTGLPNSNTTEVDTKVLLADGEAIVLGGLIRESDNELVSKIPFLGDMKYLGFFFRQRTVKRQRVEIVITLLPRIVPDEPGMRSRDCESVERAMTPLLQGPLNRVDRTRWEPDIAKGLQHLRPLPPPNGPELLPPGDRPPPPVIEGESPEPLPPPAPESQAARRERASTRR